MTGSGQKARDAAERVIAVCDILAGLVPPDVDAFTADLRTQWAVEMGLIRIGEAVNRIPDEVLEHFPSSPGGRLSRCATSPPTSTTTSTHGGYGALSLVTCRSCVPILLTL